MGLPKGRTNNSKGRTPGTKTKKTIAWEEMGSYLLSTGLQRYKDYLDRLEPKEFADRFEGLLEYFKPKMARTEITGADGKSLSITIGEPPKEYPEDENQSST